MPKKKRKKLTKIKLMHESFINSANNMTGHTLARILSFRKLENAEIVQKHHGYTQVKQKYQIQHTRITKLHQNIYLSVRSTLLLRKS